MHLAKESDKIAEYLLKIKAVRLSTRDPFTWSSGWNSPIYCDNRLILSYPEIRTAVRNAFVGMIRTNYPAAEGISGVATGGIAIGVLVAEALGLPFSYVRPTPKSHGLQNQIEGRIVPGQKVVVVEDLISTGSSSASAVHALKESSAEVVGTVAIFGYGFPTAEEVFGETETGFSTLTNLETLLKKAAEMSYIEESEMATILSWQQQPEQWGS
ncbi:MAG: orotate phosphoribosyltransferase [Bacteroidota bacterium]